MHARPHRIKPGADWSHYVLGGAAAFIAMYSAAAWLLRAAGDTIWRGVALELERTHAPFLLAALAAGAAWSIALRLYRGDRRRRRLLDRQTGLDSIRAMHWTDFERLVGEAFRRWGYRIEETGLGGADGGVDLRLRKRGQLTLVQCKHWQSRSVGAPHVREMFGLMIHHQAQAIAIVTSGSFTRQAWTFAAGKPIELIDGRKLANMVRHLQRAGH